MEFDSAEVLPCLLPIELPQRNGGHAHFIGVPPRQKSQPENLEAVAAAMRSSSSLIALTRTCRQKRSIAPARLALLLSASRAC